MLNISAIAAAPLFGAMFAGAMLPGVATPPPNNAYLIKVDPEYTFDNVDVFRRLTWTWQREWSRPDNRHRRGLHIFGPQGCGKTTVIEQFFARLNVPLICTTWNPKREAEEMVSSSTLLEGDLLPVDRAILIAARNGWPVLINEIDLADPAELMCLNDIIEKGFITLPDGTTVYAERGFIVFATSNSTGIEDETGAFAGTRSQNAATLRRFYPCRMAYPPEEVERDWLQAQCKAATLEICATVAKVGTKIRQAFDGTADGQRLDKTISRPELLDWLEMQHGMSHLATKGINVALYTLMCSYGDHLPKEQHKVLEQIVESCYGGA